MFTRKQGRSVGLEFNAKHGKHAGQVGPHNARPNTRPPSLNYQFSISRSLGVGGPALSYTRTGNHTYFDSTGTLQTAAQDVAPFDHNPTTLVSIGLSAWEARTNSVRNNPFAGATPGVIGSGGAMPANMTFTVTTTTGLTREVVGVSTENGISYLELKLSGTAVGNGSFSVFFDAIGVAAFSASAGQIYVGSLYLKLQAGDFTGLSNPRLFADEFDSGNTYRATIGGNLSPAGNPTGAALSTQRFQRVDTVTDVGGVTASVRYYFFMNIATGQAISINLRIGMPQVELVSNATDVASPVIATSGAAATRAAPAISTTDLSWYNQTEGTFVTSFISNYATGGAKFPVVFRVATAAETDRIGVGITESANVVSFGILNVVGNAGSMTRALATGVLGKVAVAYKLNDSAMSLNGSAVVADTSVDIPSNLDRLAIGKPVSASNYLNGWIQFLTYYPTRQSDSNLVSMST